MGEGINQRINRRMNPQMRMLRIMESCQTFIAESTAWLEADPDASPLDFEEDRIVLAAAARCLELFDGRRWDEFTEAYDELLTATRSWDLGGDF